MNGLAGTALRLFCAIVGLLKHRRSLTLSSTISLMFTSRYTIANVTFESSENLL